MLIPVYNPETDDLEKSYLSNAYSDGVTTIAVKNNDRFVINDRIMIGQQGQEKTEVVTVTAVNSNGTGLTTGTTKFAHSADDPVYKLRFDQIKIYRSVTGSTGTYATLVTVDLDVDNEDLETKYDDTSGLESYYYKFTFYHSINAIESAYSDIIGGGGWRRNQVGNVIDEILREISDPTESNISRSEVISYMNEVNDDLQIHAAKPFSFLKTRSALTRTANTNYLDYPTDANGKQTMWAFDHMDYVFTDSTTDPDTDVTSTMEVISLGEMRNKYTDNTISTVTVDDAEPKIALDEFTNRFRFSHPAETTAGNTFYLYYYKYFDDITSEGDVIETPTPKIYKLYVKSMYYRKRSITESTFGQTADRYMADYTVEKNKYKGVDRRDKGTPRGFRPRTSTYNSYRR